MYSGYTEPQSKIDERMSRIFNSPVTPAKPVDSMDCDVDEVNALLEAAEGEEVADKWLVEREENSVFSEEVVCLS